MQRRRGSRERPSRARRSTSPALGRPRNHRPAFPRSRSRHRAPARPATRPPAQARAQSPSGSSACPCRPRALRDPPGDQPSPNSRPDLQHDSGRTRRRRHRDARRTRDVPMSQTPRASPRSAATPSPPRRIIGLRPPRSANIQADSRRAQHRTATLPAVPHPPESPAHEARTHQPDLKNDPPRHDALPGIWWGPALPAQEGASYAGAGLSLCVTERRRAHDRVGDEVPAVGHG